MAPTEKQGILTFQTPTTLIKKLSDFFYRISNWQVALLITAITFGYFFGIFIDKSICFETEKGIKSLGTSFGFSMSDVEQFLSARTGEMITCYIDFLVKWDNLFALLYGLMYTLWISVVLKPWLSKAKWLNLFPITQTLFDFLENFKLSQIANTFLSNGAVDQSDVQLASMFTMLKWACSGITFVLLIAGIIFLISKKIRASSKV